MVRKIGEDFCTRKNALKAFEHLFFLGVWSPDCFQDMPHLELQKFIPLNQGFKCHTELAENTLERS